MTDAAVVNETPEVTAPAEQEVSQFNIPDDYKERGYVQGLKSMDDVWKKLDNSQKLIGDRGAYIPQEGATPEEVQAFIDKLDPFKEQLQSKYMAAPESYEFGELELPEGVTVSEDITNSFKEMAKSHKLTNEQANGLRADWIKHEMAMAQQRDAKLNEGFNQMAEKHFGKDWGDKVVEAGSALRDNLPEEAREMLKDYPNEVLIPMIIAIDSMKGKNAPDSPPSQQGGGNLDREALVAKRMEARNAARKNPTKENLEAYKAAQNAARGL